MRILYDGISYRVQTRVKLLWVIPLWWRDISKRYRELNDLKSSEWVNSLGRDEFEGIPLVRNLKFKIDLNPAQDGYWVQEHRPLSGWELVSYQFAVPDEHAYPQSEPMTFDTYDHAYAWVITNLG